MVKVAVGQMTAVGDVEINFATCADLAAQSQKVLANPAVGTVRCCSQEDVTGGIQRAESPPIIEGAITVLSGADAGRVRHAVSAGVLQLYRHQPLRRVRGACMYALCTTLESKVP